MRFPRLLFVLITVAALFWSATSTYDAHALPTGQKKPSVHQKRVVEVQYVCPMHADVKAKSRGKCPKCQMTLVKKRSSKTDGGHATSGAH